MPAPVEIYSSMINNNNMFAHGIEIQESVHHIIKSPEEEPLEVPEMPGLCAQTIETIEPPGNFEVPEDLVDGKSLNLIQIINV